MEVPLLAVKSIGLSELGGRKPCTLLSAAKHNKRALAAELKPGGRIDPERVRHNYSLAGAATPDGVVALADKLMAGTAGKKPTRKDYCQAVEVMFSLEASTTVAMGRYFQDCVDWCKARFGPENLLAADVHMDEDNPHCHVLIAPIRAGLWVGCSVIDQSHLKELRESFKRDVATGYGMTSEKKLTGKRRGVAVAMVLQAFESRHGALVASPDWIPIRRAVERDPGPFVASLGLDVPRDASAKSKTMAEIFTSKGAGPRRENAFIQRSNPIGMGAAVMLTTERANPIGFDADEVALRQATSNPTGIASEPETNQSLSCVGFAHPARSLMLNKQAEKGRRIADDWTSDGDDEAFQGIDIQPGTGGPVCVAGDDGTVRVRDHSQEFQHDDW